MFRSSSRRSSSPEPRADGFDIVTQDPVSHDKVTFRAIDLREWPMDRNVDRRDPVAQSAAPALDDAGQYPTFELKVPSGTGTSFRSASRAQRPRI